MLNYIRTDLRRMVRARSFRYTMLALIVFMTIVYSSYNYSFHQTQEALTKPESVITFTDREGNMVPVTDENYGQFMDSMRQAAKPVSVIQAVTTSPPVATLLTGLFFALFVSQDFGTGYLKNQMAQKGVRGKWIAGKISIVIGYVLIQFALLIALSLLGAKFVGVSIATNWWQLLPRLGMLLVYAVALASLITLAAVFTQNTAGTLAIALLLSLNVQVFLYHAVDRLAVLPFRFMDYGLLNQLPGIFLVPIANWPIRFFVIPIAVALFGGIAGYLVFRNKDIHI